jgi:UDP-N-acetyl-D-mannosaminuronic acid transferase (WecB/TagA/CpsF family)
MSDPGIGTRDGSIDLLTALDLLGKAEAQVAELTSVANTADEDYLRERNVRQVAETRVAELEAALNSVIVMEQTSDEGYRRIYNKCQFVARDALAAVRQEKP